MVEKYPQLNVRNLSQEMGLLLDILEVGAFYNSDLTVSSVLRFSNKIQTRVANLQ